MQTPKVSVILPCYNGAEFLAQAIESILRQTMPDFELLIINDGSTDNSGKIIRSFPDKRIKLIEHEKNLGLVRTLNKGISGSKGKYIARMDADDIARPERFAKQVSFLEKNPLTGVCGTWMYMIHNQTVYRHRYLSSPLIDAALLFTNPVVHPSVMMRRDIFPGAEMYNPDYPHGEDYALWLSLPWKTKFAVLDEPLLEYRAHAGQVSRNYNEVQRASVQKAQEIIFNQLQLKISEEERKLHLSLFLEEYQPTELYLAAVEAWLTRLVAANEKTLFFDRLAFRDVTGEWWFRVNSNLAPAGIGSYSRFKASALSADYIPAPAAIARLRVKSILKQGRKN